MDSGEEVCDRAGVLRQPYNPWNQLTRKRTEQKALRKHIENLLLKDGQCRASEPRGTQSSSFLGQQQGTCCPLRHTDIVLWLRACTRSEARLCPPRLCLHNNRNQKPQQTPSSSLAQDHVTGQEGKRHFDQSRIALNRFHTSISATGIKPPTP